MLQVPVLRTGEYCIVVLVRYVDPEGALRWFQRNIRMEVVEPFAASFAAYPVLDHYIVTTRLTNPSAHPVLVTSLAFKSCDAGATVIPISPPQPTVASASPLAATTAVVDGKSVVDDISALVDALESAALPLFTSSGTPASTSGDVAAPTSPRAVPALSHEDAVAKQQSASHAGGAGSLPVTLLPNEAMAFAFRVLPSASATSAATSTSSSAGPASVEIGCFQVDFKSVTNEPGALLSPVLFSPPAPNRPLMSTSMPASTSSAPVPPVSLTVFDAVATARVGEPFVITVSVTNTTSAPLSVQLGVSTPPWMQSAPASAALLSPDGPGLTAGGPRGSLFNPSGRMIGPQSPGPLAPPPPSSSVYPGLGGRGAPLAGSRLFGERHTIVTPAPSGPVASTIFLGALAADSLAPAASSLPVLAKLATDTSSRELVLLGESVATLGPVPPHTARPCKLTVVARTAGLCVLPKLWTRVLVPTSSPSPSSSSSSSLAEIPLGPDDRTAVPSARVSFEAAGPPGAGDGAAGVSYAAAGLPVWARLQHSVLVSP